MRPTRCIRHAFAGALVAWASAAPARDLAPGDLIVAVDRGVHQVRTPAGMLVESIVDGSTTYNTGCQLAADGTLWTTAFNRNEVVVFGRAHPHAVVRRFRTDGVTGVADRSNECLELVPGGDLWVGHAAGGHELHLYASDGTLRRELAPEVDVLGTDEFDLAADRRTLYYTSEGPRILRYDVVSAVQLPDFAALDPPQAAYFVRLLPPGDGSGGLLVAADAILRLDASGTAIMTYDRPGLDTWFALALAPDGRTFWAGDSATGEIVRFEIESGAYVSSFDTGTTYVGGICIFGELRAGDPCGNGDVEAGEECDDGNRVPSDGCDERCRAEPPCPALPEVGPTSLRVARTSSDVVVSFDASAIPTIAQHAHVYRGMLAAFATPARYDHASVTGSCGLAASPFTDAGAATAGGADAYYLAVLGCRDASGAVEGPYGDADDGQVARPRPAAASPCP